MKKSEIKERECGPMLDETKMKKEQSADLALLSGLTRRQLRELEEKEKTPAQKTAEASFPFPGAGGVYRLPARSGDRKTAREERLL